MFRMHARSVKAQAPHCTDDAWVHAGKRMLCTPEELKRYLDHPDRFVR